MDATPSRLVLLSKYGKLKAPIQSEEIKRVWEGGSSSWIGAYMEEERRKTPEEMLEKLQAELLAIGETEKRDGDVELKKRQILDRNLYAQRDKQDVEGEAV